MLNITNPFFIKAKKYHEYSCDYFYKFNRYDFFSSDPLLDLHLIGISKPNIRKNKEKTFFSEIYVDNCGTLW